MLETGEHPQAGTLNCSLSTGWRSRRLKKGLECGFSVSVFWAIFGLQEISSEPTPSCLSSGWASWTTAEHKCPPFKGKVTYTSLENPGFKKLWWGLASQEELSWPGKGGRDQPAPITNYSMAIRVIRMFLLAHRYQGTLVLYKLSFSFSFTITKSPTWEPHCTL